VFDLTDAVAIVTGSTKGIGLGVARQLARAGARVVVSSRSEDDCRAVADKLNAELGRDAALAQACDLADPAQLQPLVDAALGRWGRIDALVCNAADVGHLQPVGDVLAAGFAQLLQTNVVNNFLLARSVAEQMKRNGTGSITFITSIAATTPMSANLPYAAAKAAQLSTVRSLAAEYAAHGVRVNSVAPGLIRSFSSRVIWEDPPLQEAIVAQIPLGRIGEADEVGAACVFLASAAGAYVTGVNLPIDGGSAELGPVNRQAALDEVRT
jgi:NAD(P)-dependent dehydrogenase (short-subunit alcohol dehydrogenase family)